MTITDRLAPYTATRLPDDFERQWLESYDSDWTEGMTLPELVDELEALGQVQNLSHPEGMMDL